jgi:hypothetical protein
VVAAEPGEERTPAGAKGWSVTGLGRRAERASTLGSKSGRERGGSVWTPGCVLEGPIGLLPTEVTLSAKGELRRLVCSVAAATRDGGADRAKPQENLRGE